MSPVYLFCFLFSYVAFSQQFQNLQYEDRTYEANIKTVLMYPLPNRTDDIARTLYSPVININNENRPLIAEFDDLTARFRNFRFKIKHCNADWTPSNLNDIEFTYQYNDNTIDRYEASFNTKIPYYHYWIEIPKLKLGGNYLLIVYEDKRPAKLILTKRFMVYDPKVSILPNVRVSTGITEQRTHQQVDFDINYGRYELISPQEDLKIVVRQNYRWNKSLTNLKPTNVRAFDSQLEFRPFDLSNNFLAGNDFRWFDTRIGRGSGVSVAEVRQLADQSVAYLRIDEARINGLSLQASDFNGQCIVENREAGNSAIEADYLNVVFGLKTPEIPNAKIYVNGGFNQWQLDDANLMTYNVERQMYEASIFIKQGIVNYNYLIATNNKLDESSLEGNYALTTNDYELFVYHRPPAARADILVGYRLIEFGRR